MGGGCLRGLDRLEVLSQGGQAGSTIPRDLDRLEALSHVTGWKHLLGGLVLALILLFRTALAFDGRFADLAVFAHVVELHRDALRYARLLHRDAV